MAINSRDKGAVGEREWRDVLKSLGFTNSYRSAQRRGASDAPDVVGIPGTHAEVKRCEALSIYKAIEQAVSDSDGKSIPYVAHRRNHKGWLVTVRLEDLFAFADKILVERAKSLQESQAPE